MVEESIQLLCGVYPLPLVSQASGMILCLCNISLLYLFNWCYTDSRRYYFGSKNAPNRNEFRRRFKIYVQFINHSLSFFGFCIAYLFAFFYVGNLGQIGVQIVS